ncbi:hypothetical protein B4923_09385 [Brenneria roseae subsp. americana]|uniref:Uncharacterized protein n=1 Tax=Brenneria roseae subsp. americana TaxID=1508507 RepID=A0A2U1TTK3_9GAMM|nr:hypothetical protein [Brenneria roseae]PWC12737.1 hypothetical protein B4923_09385 [Brenneria roseae subsp. americana]
MIKKGMCTLLLALPLCSLAAFGNADLIAGYTSQELATALPAKVMTMTQHDVVVDELNHSLLSEYVDSQTGNKALVTLYTLPLDKHGKVPEASHDSDLDFVITSTEKEMLRQRIRPDKRDVPVDETTKFRCLQSVLNNKVLHSLCSMLVKGRVLEIQAINMLDNAQDEAALQQVLNQQNRLITEIGKALLTFKK